MAILYITEYQLLAQDAGNEAQMPLDPPLAQQTVAIGASSAQSAAFNTATQFIRIHADAVCSILIGTNPTATATSSRMAANQTEYRGVPAGGGYKIAVITNT
jgi:hypothetical protein